jgi:3D (Asp-Asp-Asp) domain-containing protein
MTLLATVAASLAALTANSTAYSPCSAGSIMADGTHVRLGSVAMNRHPLGTRITLTSRSFYGMRRFTVRDRIGYGSDLDFWTPSCRAALAWGRRTVTYRIGWAGAAR